MRTTLPTDSAARKRYPLRTGCFNYFPAALAGVAQVSMDGNDKHNPGQELHHSRGKSSDHADCIDRHLTDIQDIIAYLRRSLGVSQPKSDIVQALLKEANQLAWRALALSQELHEVHGGSPIAPAAKFEDAAPAGRLDNEWKKPPALIELERQKALEDERRKLRELYDKDWNKKIDRVHVVEYPIRPYEPRPASNAAALPATQVQNGYAY